MNKWADNCMLILQSCLAVARGHSRTNRSSNHVHTIPVCQLHFAIWRRKEREDCPFSHPHFERAMFFHGLLSPSITLHLAVDWLGTSCLTSFSTFTESGNTSSNGPMQKLFWKYLWALDSNSTYENIAFIWNRHWQFKIIYEHKHGKFQRLLVDRKNLFGSAWWFFSLFFPKEQADWRQRKKEFA